MTNLCHSDSLFSSTVDCLVLSQFHRQKDVFDESVQHLQAVRLLNKDFNEHAVNFLNSFTQYNDRDALKEVLRLRYLVRHSCPRSPSS